MSGYNEALLNFSFGYRYINVKLVAKMSSTVKSCYIVGGSKDV